MRFLRLSPLAALALPQLALAQAPTTFQALANVIVRILNAGVVLLIAATIVYYFYGITQDILKRGGGRADDHGNGYLIKGILILFVMISIWGIIQLIQYTLFGSPQSAGGNGSTYYQSL